MRCACNKCAKKPRNFPHFFQVDGPFTIIGAEAWGHGELYSQDDGGAQSRSTLINAHLVIPPPPLYDAYYTPEQYLRIYWTGTLYIELKIKVRNEVSIRTGGIRPISVADGDAG